MSIIRNKETSRTDFVFYADRIIRILIEEGNAQERSLKEQRYSIRQTLGTEALY